MTAAQHTAAQQWADELAAWAIDPEILAAAPESPYDLPPEVFAAGQDRAPSPLAELAGAALHPGGTILDVGAGAGATSLDVVPPDGHLHAVDTQPAMLRALEAAARERRVSVTTYVGTWPDVADQVPGCHVAVCAHVFYKREWHGGSGSVCGLTFDMRGGRQLAKPDVARPLDGRVRRHFGPWEGRNACCSCEPGAR